MAGGWCQAGELSPEYDIAQTTATDVGRSPTADPRRGVDQL